MKKRKTNHRDDEEDFSSEDEEDFSAAIDLGGDDDLLADRQRSRKRGFKPWRPSEEAAALLEEVNAVLAEYAEHLPLTIRQIFYRLVGAHDYEKTEEAYKRLCRRLNDARRARLVRMDAIRDDTGTVLETIYYESAGDV